MKKKQWIGPKEWCATCDKLETSDHILFQYSIVVFLWSFLRSMPGWQKSPTNYANFLVELVDEYQGRKQKVTLFIYAKALWTV